MKNKQYEGKTLNFHDLLKEGRVEIPIIQRDYAQGRADKGKIRDNFLKALFVSIDKENPIMLDFVYGSNTDESFQPLDGQQRLTTLFLLYWYAANKDNHMEEAQALLSNFTYETRITSRDFCKILVQKEILIAPDSSVSNSIIDSPWFFLSWKNDPTIDSMLRMLDDIHRYFFVIEDLWKKLNNTSNGLIQFYHVELENIGLTDDLYIKMNARGKLLTPFENFKAGFEKKIRDNGWEENKSLEQRFANKIDTIWTDFFWKNFRKNNSIDEAFIRYLSAIAMIRQSVNRLNKTEERLKIISELQDDPRKLSPKEFNEDDFNYLTESLDLYSEKYDSIKDKNLDLPFWRHSAKTSLLNEIAGEDLNASYTQKVLLYAQLEYFLKAGDDIHDEKYSEWMRVIRNLVSRGDIEKTGKRPDVVRSPQTFDGMVNLVNELSEGCLDIHEYLNNISKTKSTFAKDQVLEEINKAQLIKTDPALKEIIYKIEDTNLLRGRVEFALYCANYVGGKINKDLLEEIEEVLSKYFRTEEVSNDLRRALLSIEVNGKFEFYNYWWSLWNVVSSNKRRLIDNYRELEFLLYSEQREYLKNLVLKLIKESPEDIARNFTAPVGFPNWKMRLIKEKDLLDKKSKSNFIAIAHDESFCYLLKSKRPRDKKGCVQIL